MEHQVDVDALLEGVHCVTLAEAVEDPCHYVRSGVRPILGVVADKYEEGLDPRDRWVWPGLARSPLGCTSAYMATDLDQAMRTAYRTDAHFVAYVLQDEEGRVLAHHPRLTIDGRGLVERAGFNIKMTVRVADIDNPGHQKWTPELLSEAVKKLSHPMFAGCIVYTTSAGLRIIEAGDRWLSIEEHQHVLPAWLARIQRETGLVPDAACKDWTRHFRLPRVVRDRVPTKPQGKWTYSLYEVGDVVVPTVPKLTERQRISAAVMRVPVRDDRAVERAEAYIKKIGIPVCGAGTCEKTTFRVACILIEGFALPPQIATHLLQQWSDRGDHRWGKGAISRKVEGAVRVAQDVGHMLRGGR
jgi:hypothetical protein